MKYILNNSLFRRLLIGKGYANLLDFSRKTLIHRNTLNNYISGKSVFAGAFEDIAEKLDVSPLELIMPISDTSVDIDNIDELKPVIAKIVGMDKNIAVLLLGSRANRREKKYSDWDIGITRSSNQIEAKEYLRIKEAVLSAADDLPRSVDIINLDSAPVWFIKNIDYEPVFLDGKWESYLYFKGVLDGIKKAEAA